MQQRWAGRQGSATIFGLLVSALVVIAVLIAAALAGPGRPGRGETAGGPGGGSSDGRGGEAAGIRADIRAASVEVREFEVPGPAAGADGDTHVVTAADGVNRVGSDAVTVRSYVPSGAPWATLVWAHGGSFVHGGLDWPEADWVALRFAEAGVRVYSVDYALASDTVKAPAPVNDLGAVVEWVAANSEGPLVVGGASAGAHLAVLAALGQADRAAASSAATSLPGAAVRAADALVLEYPTLHRVQREDASIADAVAELPEQRRFRPARIADMYGFYLGEPGADGPADAADATGELIAGELESSRLALLPPTVIVNADADELRASAEQFAEQLRGATVPVIESVQAGTVHGYMNRPEASAQAEADARETIARFVEELRRILG
ncbi:alpha/beta hydrolase fold domain-containing protein [Leucobacter sp. gxy201]|uniref:alpha/beta hydrolase n=1 Tax=Leucobacter sp. gxy201 TaxID=2957200 RepID=UPI003DA03490